MRHSSEPSPYKILPGMNEGRKAGFVHERKYPVPRATYIFYTPPCLPGAISQHSSSSHTETKNSRSTADAACRLLSPNGFPLFAPFVPAQTGIPDKPWILTGPCPGNSNIPHTASTLPPPTLGLISTADKDVLDDEMQGARIGGSGSPRHGLQGLGGADPSG